MKDFAFGIAQDQGLGLQQMTAPSASIIWHLDFEI
jgi:hypothetical protein